MEVRETPVALLLDGDAKHVSVVYLHKGDDVGSVGLERGGCERAPFAAM